MNGTLSKDSTPLDEVNTAGTTAGGFTGESSKSSGHIPCPITPKQIVRYVLHDTQGDERLGLEQHFSECSVCRTKLYALNVAFEVASEVRANRSVEASDRLPEK
jgi:hypothetical protein